MIKVRKAGYKAIGDCSRADRSLVRRNADVLVQLLQNGMFDLLTVESLIIR